MKEKVLIEVERREADVIRKILSNVNSFKSEDDTFYKFMLDISCKFDEERALEGIKKGLSESTVTTKQYKWHKIDNCSKYIDSQFKIAENEYKIAEYENKIKELEAERAHLCEWVQNLQTKI